MKTLTIRLPDELARRLEQESRERRVTKSEIVRERLDNVRPALTEDSGLKDILQASWSAKTRSRPRAFRSSKKQKLTELIRAKKLHR